MKWLNWLTSTKEEKRTLDRNTAPSLLRSWAETPAAGVAVTTRSALSIPTVFAAVSAVADTVSTLPLPVYRDGPNGPEKDRTHPVYRLLNTAPNRVQTAKAYRAAMVVDLMSEGEHFSEVQRDGSGQPIALYRIEPCAVVTKWVEEDGAYVLEYSVGGTVIPSENLLHVVGFTSNGFRGESPFRLCQDSLSLTLALDRFGSSFVRRGARPGGILTAPPGLSPEDLEDSKKSWADAQAGYDAAGKTAVLPEGFKYSPMSLSPEEGQFHDSRIQQMREAQRITRTPPNISGDFERQTWNNVAAAQTMFVTQSIKPICVAIEQAVNKTLLNNDPNVWAEFVIEGLMRGTFPEQIAALTEAVTSGIYTANEARRLFNLPDHPDGDTLGTPSTPTPSTPQESNGNTLAA